MAKCPHCSHGLVRSRRKPVERLLYAEVLRCRHCDYRTRIVRHGISSTFGFVAARHTQCIRCGNSDVQRLHKRDRIDSVSWHPLSMLMMLTGAPINHCHVCRLQYRDWRPIKGGASG